MKTKTTARPSVNSRKVVGIWMPWELMMLPCTAWMDLAKSADAKMRYE